MITDATRHDSGPPTTPYFTDEPSVRVLLAEEDRETRRLIASALRRDGHQVLEARDGVKLLELIGEALVDREGAGVPDIIISDIRLPRRSGLEVLAGLRREDWTTPVILIAPFKDAETNAEAYRLGADVVLETPLDVDDVRLAVRTLIAIRG